MNKTTKVGYRTPPTSTRFPKGRSGNPKGRPKGRHNRPPHDAVLSRMVTIKEDGVERQVTAAEAFLVHMIKRALDGDVVARRSTAAALEEARSARTVNGYLDIRAIILTIVTPGSVNSALVPLRMASKFDRYRPSARMMLEPWLVKRALSRLGEVQLSVEEQAKVVRAVRTPHKVRWPAWWKVRP